MIKKLIVSLFFVIPLVSHAQISGLSKDDFIFSARSSVVNYNTTDKDFLNHQFNLSFGEMYSKKVAVGVDFGFGTDGKIADNFSAGVFARYYSTPTNAFSFLTKGTFQYFRTQNEAGQLNNGGSLIFSPGVSYFVTNRLAFEAFFGNVGYTTSKTEFDNSSRVNNFVLGFDATNLSFGVILRGK